MRRTNTKPEIALRRALHRLGLRFRVDYSRIPGHPDVAFPRQQVAVFVDGDFWHGKGWRQRGFRSLEDQFSNWNRGEWWLAKIRRNVARDKLVDRRLRRSGWRVIRFTESRLGRSLDDCALKILSAVKP